MQEDSEPQTVVWLPIDHNPVAIDSSGVLQIAMGGKLQVVDKLTMKDHN